MSEIAKSLVLAAVILLTALAGAKGVISKDLAIMLTCLLPVFSIFTMRPPAQECRPSSYGREA